MIQKVKNKITRIYSDDNFVFYVILHNIMYSSVILFFCMRVLK